MNLPVSEPGVLGNAGPTLARGPLLADVVDDDGAIASAVAAALGALVSDKDVSSVDVVEGGLPEVVRRGRRERLQLLVEGPLFEVLRERLSGPGSSSHLSSTGSAAARVALPAQLTLHTAMLSDGRVALRLRRPAPTDVSLAHLEEEGLLPPGVAAELAGAVFAGHGLLVMGAASAAADRVAVAAARTAAARLRVWALGTDVPAQAMPAPLGKDVVTRAGLACALGADVVYGLGLSVTDVAALLRATLPVPLLASVASPSVAAFAAGLGELPRDVAGVIVVTGFDADGIPRVFELHSADGQAPSSSPSPSSSSSSSSSSSLGAGDAGVVPIVETSSPLPTSSSLSRRGAPPPVLDEAPGLAEAPPADWASDNIDDDPGWELGPIVDEPAPKGSFDAALQDVAKRPAFQPAPPRPHPQAAALRGTGGLTFEPPPGGGEEP